LGCRLFGNPTFFGIGWVAKESQPNQHSFNTPQETAWSYNADYRIDVLMDGKEWQ